MGAAARRFNPNHISNVQERNTKFCAELHGQQRRHGFLRHQRFRALIELNLISELVLKVLVVEVECFRFRLIIQEKN